MSQKPFNHGVFEWCHSIFWRWVHCFVILQSLYIAQSSCSFLFLESSGRSGSIFARCLALFWTSKHETYAFAGPGDVIQVSSVGIGATTYSRVNEFTTLVKHHNWLRFIPQGKNWLDRSQRGDDGNGLLNRGRSGFSSSVVSSSMIFQLMIENCESRPAAWFLFVVDSCVNETWWCMVMWQSHAFPSICDFHVAVRYQFWLLKSATLCEWRDNSHVWASHL